MDLSQAAADVTLDSTPRVRPTNPTSNSTVTCEYHLSPLKRYRILVRSIFLAEQLNMMTRRQVLMLSALESNVWNVTQIAI